VAPVVQNQFNKLLNIALMKRFLIASLCIVLVFFTMCKKQADENDIIDFSKLNGNNFILKVDRISLAPGVQYPRDSLQESDYSESNEGIQHEVTFSENGQIVSINPGSVSGGKTNDGQKSKLYKLTENLFAGGRFIVWINNKDFEAEYTVYGSGIPIISSERGKLELMIK
jgi:hypothetical protein